MLKVTIDGTEIGAGQNDPWLTGAHFPAQWQKAFKIYEEERRELGRVFDPNLLSNLSGRLHIKIHQNAWELNPGFWVAGVYRPSSYIVSPQEYLDGIKWIDLIEMSWYHEYDFGYDTLEHELGHMIAFRNVGNPSTHSTDYPNFGHGNKSDPVVQSINQKILRVYHPNYPGFPGLLPQIQSAMTLTMLNNKNTQNIVRCRVFGPPENQA